MNIAPLPPEPATGRHWRASAVRLIAIYGAFFVAWSVVLVGTINWQTTRYLDRVVGEILEQRVHYLAGVDRAHLPEMMAATNQLDLRGVMYYGLFDARRGYLSGTIDHLPDDLPIDAQIHALPNGFQTIAGERKVRSLGVAVRLDDGDVLLLARNTSVADRIGTMTRSAFGWALSLVLIPGLIGGFLLSRGPLRRVRGIEAAIAPITRGDLGVRLPLSPRRDELDMLASVVNRTLDEIERLLGEVKGVTDGIAHDLRTPLTRLRAQLYRLQREGDAADPRTAVIERCIVDVDALLDRFRALLRLSELEDLGRRAAFEQVDPAEVLGRIHELFAPLAEEKNIAFALKAGTLPSVRADAALLFEALSNLVDNAIKFTPTGGAVELHATAQSAGVRIDVLDNGPGIPEAERGAVLRRFQRSRDASGDGHGLGLSLVAAIAHLHGYCLEIAGRDGGGARMTLYCWPCSKAGARSG